jgi:hypothetical protein
MLLSSEATRTVAYILTNPQAIDSKKLEVIFGVVLWKPEPPIGATCCEPVKDCRERFGHEHVNGDAGNEKTSGPDHGEENVVQGDALFHVEKKAAVLEDRKYGDTDYYVAGCNEILTGRFTMISHVWLQ